MTNAVGRFFFFSVVCPTLSLLNRWHCDCVIAIMNIINNATAYDLSLLPLPTLKGSCEMFPVEFTDFFLN